MEHKLHCYKKDTHRKEFPLSAIASVAAGEGTKALDVTINFKETHPYYIRCRCQEHYDGLLELLGRVVACDG